MSGHKKPSSKILKVNKPTDRLDPMELPPLCQHIVEGNGKLSSSDIDQLFRLLVRTPLSYEQLLVIVVDVLDECGGRVWWLRVRFVWVG